MRAEQVAAAKRVIITVVCELFGGTTAEETVIRTLSRYESMGEFSDIDGFESHYNARGGAFLVLLSEDRVVGTGALRRLDETTAELKRMWFLPEFRGLGLGRRMAEQLLQTARESGFARVRLDTDARQVRARKLYETLGFRPIERYNQNAWSDTFMELVLEPRPDFDCRLVSDLDDTTRAVVHNILRNHNLARNPDFFRLRDEPPHQPRPLEIIARDTAGEVLGGLLAETQFLWLKISIMGVAPQARGRGIGTRLVELAEAEAVARLCRYSFVDTMCYQAPGFYEKLGYEAAGRLPNWDSHGHTKLFYVKQLAGDNSSPAR